MDNEIRHLFQVILFAIHKYCVITFTIYIAFVEKWISFCFLRTKSKDREKSTEMGDYLEDILK